MWFQSLLFWMIGSGSVDLLAPIGFHAVSILVVLDDWFGVDAFGWHRESGTEVSILVVLDDWFGVPRVDGLGFSTTGFNPCCFG